MGKAVYIILMAFRYLRHRAFSTVISICAISVMLVFITITGNINFAVKKAAAEGSVRYPLVVGPSGTSGIQLVMSSVFHIDKPSGTVPFSIYERLKSDERVINAYPIAVADSIYNFPIIGTDEDFLRSISPAAMGAIDLSKKENAVLGFAAAKRLDLRPGDKFKGTHGTVGGEEAEEHSQLSYNVTGILAKTGGPEDSAVYIDYKTVWSVHDSEGEHHQAGKAEAEKKEDEPDTGKLTAVLVRTKNPAYTGNLEREFSQVEGVQAVDTGRTVRKMADYLNKAESIMEVFNIATMAVMVLMIFVTIMMSLNERRRELALMRSLGIGRGAIAAMIASETLVITLGGIILGAVTGHLSLWWLKYIIDFRLGINIEPFTVTAMEADGMLIVFIAGQILALGAMIISYRMNLLEETSK